MPTYTELVKEAQLDFIGQNMEIVRIAYDQGLLGARPYMQTVTESPTAGATEKDKTSVDSGEVWLLSKVIHRDIEPGIFTLKIIIDGQIFFPSTTLDNLQFLLTPAKAYPVKKYIEFTITNNDTVTKDYKAMVVWQKYNKTNVNDFLQRVGAPKFQ